jgi:uncharacterized protein (TIGR04168 family)
VSAALEIAVLGDTHGHFDEALDAALLERYPLRLCTGDLPANRGRDRFDDALRQARGLASLGVWTVLGNHDGPAVFTGRRFPRSYRRLEKALGGLHVGGRRVELPALGLSLVGGRPLSCGARDYRFPVPGREEWSLEQWGEHLGELIAGAAHERVVVLAHDGPSGLGSGRADIWGRDFGGEEGDWGDPDLRAALDHAAARGRRVTAVIAGHMHHRLQGGGRRARCTREDGTLVLNAAVVPRVRGEQRALTVVRLEERGASARIEWHGPGGAVEVEELGDERVRG